MALNDYYLVTVRGHANASGTAIQNTFPYQMTTGVGTAADMADAFATNVALQMRAISHAQYVQDDLYVVNLSDPDDFTTLIIDEPGLEGGEFLPIYNSWEFGILRTTRAIQNGRKAIGIIAESDQENGVAASVITAGLALMAVKMLATISNALSSASFSPRLWRRPGTYAGGAVAAPGVFWPIANVTYNRISTQSTRKIGRGI